MTSTFRPGWYEIAFDRKTYRSRCRYFRSRSLYTAECIVDSNGRQYLLWQDQNGPTGAGRPGEWSSTYKPLATAGDGDWWDNPTTSRPYKPALASAAPRNLRMPTPREQCQRAGAADRSAFDLLGCSKEIHVGIFFDGTNNNRTRDKGDLSHSNVVSLFDAHKSDQAEYFSYYLPGVGTKFEEIGEKGEDSSGKTFAAGGERRIHYAMLHVYNAVCAAATGVDLVPAKEMSDMVNSVFSLDGLATLPRVFDTRMNAVFERLDARLMRAIEGRRPRITNLHLSVFGFSRGAAQARVFCKWIQMASRGRIGAAALNMRFLGLFDTVASVGLAASGPVFNGFFDWANGNMEIAGVERTAHFVAAHELRYSFPLSTARSGGTYGPGVREYIYPGCHSDIGGGYRPGSQGKATDGRPSLLSQIPLIDMLWEAINAGAKVQRLDEMPGQTLADFKLNTKLDQAFSAYCRWTTYDEKENVAESRAGPTEDRMKYHTHRYWQWRAKVSAQTGVDALGSFRAANAQDRIDLAESERDWQADLSGAREAIKPTKRFVPRVGYVDVPPVASDVQRKLLKETGSASPVPLDVEAFFDNYIHDSHAGFYLLGAQTKIDKAVFIQSIKDKKRLHDMTVAEMERTADPNALVGLIVLARHTRLNRFEQLVLSVDAKTPNELPPMSDADAADLRDNAGFFKGSVIIHWLLRTGTRREAQGHGHYREVFDHS